MAGTMSVLCEDQSIPGCSIILTFIDNDFMTE